MIFQIISNQQRHFRIDNYFYVTMHYKEWVFYFYFISWPTTDYYVQVSIIHDLESGNTIYWTIQS